MNQEDSNKIQEEAKKDRVSDQINQEKVQSGDGNQASSNDSDKDESNEKQIEILNLKEEAQQEEKQEQKQKPSNEEEEEDAREKLIMKDQKEETLEKNKELSENQKTEEVQKKQISREQEKKQINQEKKQEPMSFPSKEVQEPINQVQNALEMMTVQIIKTAQKERIGVTFDHFLNYMKKHDLHSQNQKKVILSIYDEIDRKKKQKNVLYQILKEYFNQYSNLTKDFHEKSYKISRNQNKNQSNKLINMGEQLKDGFQELVFLRKSTGNDFQRLNQYLAAKTFKELELVIYGYLNQINKIQGQSNEKKKVFLEQEDTFKKRVWKLTKIFNRGKQGKPQDEDVFIETLKFIRDQKLFKEALINWGKTIPQLKKNYIKADQKLIEELQNLLNNFKNQSNNLYSIHKEKFSKIIPAKSQILSIMDYNKLSTLIDSDYIKYALEILHKKEVGKFSDRDFQTFIQMAHFQLITGDPVELLRGTLSKSFQLKNKDEELINTISGNLVLYNKIKIEFKDKFVVKNLSAQIIGDGIVQFDEVVKGIIFDSNKSARITLKDEDRAEELICFLNEKL